MSGSVVTAGDAPSPIEGATVKTVCEKQTREEATTDAKGTFYSAGIGHLKDTCEVRVTKAGYGPQAYSVGDHCQGRSVGDACYKVQVDAKLKPASPGLTPMRASRRAARSCR